MSRNKYQPIDFVGLTKVLRAHATQISPPGMYELKNVYISRSDNSATLRPNFLREETGMVSPELLGRPATHYPLLRFLTTSRRPGLLPYISR